jgi:hypothetical protein
MVTFSSLLPWAILIRVLIPSTDCMAYVCALAVSIKPQTRINNTSKKVFGNIAREL